MAPSEGFEKRSERFESTGTNEYDFTNNECEAKEATCVERALNDIISRLEDLNKTIYSTAEKLAPCLSETEHGAEVAEEISYGTSPLANKLARVAERIEAARYNVQEIKNRTEL